LLICIIGYFCWIISRFCGVEISFGDEKVLDIGFVDSPEAFFDALALLGDQLFRLARQIGDAIPYFWPPLKPTGIYVRGIIRPTLPANFTVRAYPRLRQRPQSGKFLMFRVPQRARPRRCYCEDVRVRHFLPYRRTYPVRDRKFENIYFEFNARLARLIFFIFHHSISAPHKSFAMLQF
jgi:hypothetical protein